MSDFDEPAYPHNETDHAHGATSTRKPGLTIRQTAVLMAMQGMLASWPEQKQMDTDRLASLSCTFADAVLKAERESRE